MTASFIISLRLLFQSISKLCKLPFTISGSLCETKQLLFRRRQLYNLQISTIPPTSFNSRKEKRPRRVLC